MSKARQRDPRDMEDDQYERDVSRRLMHLLTDQLGAPLSRNARRTRLESCGIPKWSCSTLMLILSTASTLHCSGKRLSAAHRGHEQEKQQP
jgi:hypothetical protein